jgi:predicted NBD/HSP70 family sugar kinase
MQGHRLLHRQRVVHLLRTSGPLARSDLARILGVTRSTITAIVTDLVADGTLVELDHRVDGPNSRGRPRTLLVCNPLVRRVVGIWIDERHAHIVIADATGNVSNQGHTPVGERDPYSVIESIVHIGKELMDSPGGPVAAAGICIPGFVNSAAGTVDESGSPAWSQVALGQSISQGLEIPAAVMNTTHALTLAEAIAGKARGARSAVVLDCGACIGVGLIIDGRPYTGATGAAGVVGFTGGTPLDEPEFSSLWHAAHRDPPSQNMIRDIVDRIAYTALLIEAIVDPELLIISGLSSELEELGSALQSRITELRQLPRRDRTKTELSHIGREHRVPVIVALQQLDEDIAALLHTSS